MDLELVQHTHDIPSSLVVPSQQLTDLIITGYDTPFVPTSRREPRLPDRTDWSKVVCPVLFGDRDCAENNLRTTASSPPPKNTSTIQ